MAKAKKDNIIPQGKNNPIDQKKEAPKTSIFDNNSALRINLAIGTVTLSISILLLYILNKLILSNYNPDIKAILDKVLPLSIQPPQSFAPEPVERMQFQLSLICAPLFIFFTYFLINKKRAFFENNSRFSFFINIAGISALLIYTLIVFKQDLLYVPDETTKYFFANNAISHLNLLVIIILYSLFTWLFFLHYNSKESSAKKTIVNIVSYVIVLFIITDIVLYNVFNLAMQEWGRLMETNAVFYSVTQVYAGKSLLVDINAQYGLYAWILCPLFKLIGLSTFKFGMVMAILNGLSFLLVYLGIKRLIKQDVLSLIVFLTFTWWIYWQSRIPFESTARYYYQYYPIRLIFPALSFFLIVFYQSSSAKLRRIILPLLALSSSIAVLWNLDTGIVLFGATLLALLYAAIDKDNLKNTIKNMLVYTCWMVGALLLVVITFMVSTKAHSGLSPEFAKFAAFQNMFYISGFFMLPMSAIHFWNMPVIVYLIACSYCVYYFRKAPLWDTPVIVFLFILGCGVFAYFQGRSYDMTLDAVMYPAIILLGVFCSKLIPGIQFEKGQFRFHESIILFLIAFLFFIDSAFSMLYNTPSIHSFSVNNAFTRNPEKENALKQRMDFLADNLHQRDTALILAQDYDSYYYAAGQYYNPVKLPGSTEIFFKSEIDTLLNFIKATKYPIIYDALHPSANSEVIVKALAQYTQVEKALPDKTMLMLKWRKEALVQRLAPDAKTIYYNNAGEFNKYINPSTKVGLPENYTIELYATLDSSKLKKDNLLFSNVSPSKQFSGVVLVQYGPDLSQYLFTYGNGSAWCNGIPCKLHTGEENHLIIKVEKSIIVVYNNNELCGQVNTNSIIKNSDSPFFVNPAFAGNVEELRITAQ